MDDLLGTEGVAESNGAAGALTAGLTDRTRALGQAVASLVRPVRNSVLRRGRLTIAPARGRVRCSPFGPSTESRRPETVTDKR